MNIIISVTIAVVLVAGGIAWALFILRKITREAKNYERGLKVVPLLIHLPPSSDDIEGGGRDERDVTEETISQAQVMYNIIASTATKGFMVNKVYGQRHLAFEIIATKGLIHYYVAVPIVLLDVVKQAVAAAYPSARLEEIEEHNLFSKVGKVSGTIGGELTLKKDYAYPIATYQETKRDAMRAILNALSVASRDDGVGIQILLRPAKDVWSKNVVGIASKIRKDKGKKGNAISRDLLSVFWKPPEIKEVKPEDKQLTSLEQTTVEGIEEKTRHPGYEVLIRVIVSSNTAAQSQALMKNVVAAFSLFDSPGKNGFSFSVTRNVEQFVTAFIFRFFPQQVNKNILNSVEIATIFHLPDQKNIPTSQLQRQASKQVDGPHHVLDEGFLLGYNMFRGVKKPIRLGTIDRRRHTYIIGQTGTGKSGLLENLVLQDMLDGKGFAFVDPHGDSAERLLGMVPKERVEDVIYFSPGDMDHPIGLNLFEFKTPDQRDFLVQETLAMLYRLYDPGHTGIMGPRYENWFRNAALTIMSDPAGTSFIDVPQVFNDNNFAKEKLKHVTDQTVLDFWNKEMAQTSDYHKSEMLGWFVSKFGAFLSNEMMRNIIGQTKSGFDIREIMDNRKILLVNLSKGKTGELNSQLLGMIFVMKFQVAAMSRSDTPEDQREDFTLYVDEFQNFATDSFENILSEARKYRLNLILANQFMTQLTDKIREAIIGNVGTVISGRIGTTDAELMAKKFTPTFSAEDLTKLPNFETVASVMINNVPSTPFSMSLIPPLGQPNPKLAEALKRLSAAKYGRNRGAVEKAIFDRLRAGDVAREAKRKSLLTSTGKTRPVGAPAAPGGSSFLDEWLAKRKKLEQKPPLAKPPAPAPHARASQAAPAPSPPALRPKQPVGAPKLGSEPLRFDQPSKPPASTPQPTGAPVPSSDAPPPVFSIPSPQSEVELLSASQARHRAQEGRPGDSQVLEEELAKARAQPEMETPQSHDTLVVPRDHNKNGSGQQVDEIYIDVKGNLHHAPADEKKTQ